MKKQIYLKLGLVSLAAAMLILSVNCKNPFKNESAKDNDVIVDVASQSVADVMTFPALAGVRAAMQSISGPCQAESKHINISKSCAPYIANSAPGHGWYSGYVDYALYANCNFRMTLFTDFNCILGATIANTHDTLGGSLSLRGTFDMSAAGAVSMTFDETGIFEVNNRSHNVFIHLRVNGDSTGHGTITISGSVDNGPIYESVTY